MAGLLRYIGRPLRAASAQTPAGSSHHYAAAGGILAERYCRFLTLSAEKVVHDRECVRDPPLGNDLFTGLVNDRGNVR